MLLRSSRHCQLRCAAAGRKGSRGGTGDAPKDGEPLKASPGQQRKADHASPAPLVLHIPSGNQRPVEVRRSAFRRKRVSDEELRQRKEQARREQEETLRRFAKLVAEGPEPALEPPVLLLDGYNLLNADPNLKQYMGVSDTLRFARAELERRVQAYARASGARCTIVYDAMSRYDSRLPAELQNRTEELDEGVSIVFSTTMEADSYIICSAQTLKKRGSSRVYIVSNDNRIHAESGEPADEVIGRLDVDTFLQDLHDCRRGITTQASTRFFSGASAPSALPLTYDQARAAAAAKARLIEEQSRRLPLVDSLDVSQKLAQELGVKLEAIAAAPGEGPSQELGQEHAAKADEPVKAATLSADLNSLFGPTTKRSSPRKRF